MQHETKHIYNKHDIVKFYQSNIKSWLNGQVINVYDKSLTIRPYGLKSTYDFDIKLNDNNLKPYDKKMLPLLNVKNGHIQFRISHFIMLGFELENSQKFVLDSNTNEEIYEYIFH